MTELYPADADLNALSGTTGDSGLPHMTIGQSPHYTWWCKYLNWLDRMIRETSAALQVYKDGALTYGVRAGRFMDGDTVRNYAAAAAQALTDNTTNYIYITAAGTLTKNTTGFPVPSVTPHIPLATILTAAGDYDPLTDIPDYRGRSLLAVQGRAWVTGTYTIPVTSVKRTGDLSDLPTAGDLTNLGRAAGAHGADSPSLESTTLNNNSFTEKARFPFAMPPEYVAGQAVTLRLHVYGPDVQVSATIDVEAHVSGRQAAGSASADICATAAQDIDNHAWANVDFAITPMTLIPGDLLDIEITVVADDTGGAVASPVAIGDVQMLLAVKG